VKTRAEREAAGYRFDTMGRCRGVRCDADIEWWWTPRGKHLPFNADGEPHWATCVDERQFRTKASPRRA